MTTPTHVLYRQARLEDIPAMMSIRNGVRENALVHTVIDVADYARAMTQDGRAWVCESGGVIVGFSCGRSKQGDIWALFVRKEHEGRGIGRALLERAETWLFAQGLEQIWLTTSPETRADRLYRRCGWAQQGHTPSGEVKYALAASARGHATIAGGA